MVIDGDNLPSPVEIGLTDLPNIWRASDRKGEINYFVPYEALK